MEAKMEALKEAHVRGLMLPYVPPSLPDAHQTSPNLYFEADIQTSHPDGLSSSPISMHAFIRPRLCRTSETRWRP